MNRKEAEDDREDKLVELRKKYLDSKGIISKAKPSAKVKLTGLDKVEAEREAKLVELRKKYLAKKRAVAKKKSNTVVTAGKQRTVKTREGGNSTDTGKQRTVKTREGGIPDTGKQRTVKTREGGIPDTGKQRTVKTRAGKKKRKIPEGRSINMKVPKSVSKRKIPEGRSTNMKVPKSVSKMSLAEKKVYFNVVNKERPSAKREIKKSSAGTFVTYPQFTLAEYLKLSKHDRYLMGLPETDERLSRNSRNILTFTKIKN